MLDAVLIKDLHNQLTLMLTGMLVVYPSKSEQLVDAFPCRADPVPIDRQDSCAIWRRPHIKGEMDAASGETDFVLHALLVLSVFVHDPQSQSRGSPRWKIRETGVHEGQKLSEIVVLENCERNLTVHYPPYEQPFENILIDCRHEVT